MVKKSNKKHRGGMVRAGSVQHFRRGKANKLSKKRKLNNKSTKRLKGGMVRSGSVQHFRRGKANKLSKRKVKKSIKHIRVKKH